VTERTLVHGSLYLFIDLITVALGAWIFWFVVSKFASATEIGFATTTISLVTLIGGFSLLGLDYSLLRESRNPGVFPTIMIFQLGLLAILSPIVFVVGSAIYGADFNSFMILGVIYLVSLGLQITSTFCILGLLKSQYVLLAHTIGTASRFAVGILLILWGFGGLGILWAMIAQSLIIGTLLTAISLRKVGFAILSLGQLNQILNLGLSNLPNRVAQLTMKQLVYTS